MVSQWNIQWNIHKTAIAPNSSSDWFFVGYVTQEAGIVTGSCPAAGLPRRKEAAILDAHHGPFEAMNDNDTWQLGSVAFGPLPQGHTWSARSQKSLVDLT